MNLSLSFFKKTFITGVGLAMVAAAGMALFSHANAIQNDQTTPHGQGYALGLSFSHDKLTKVDGAPTTTPPGGPNVCSSTENSNCFCPHVGTLCVRCPAVNTKNLCVWCPPNTHPAMGVACRIFTGNNNAGGNQNVSGAASPGITSPGSPPVGAAPSSTPPTDTGSGSIYGGGNIPGDPSPQPVPIPVSATCPSNPRMMIACQIGGNPNCPYLAVCRVED